MVETEEFIEHAGGMCYLPESFLCDVYLPDCCWVEQDSVPAPRAHGLLKTTDLTGAFVSACKFMLLSRQTGFPGRTWEASVFELRGST